MLANSDISKEELMASPDKVLKVISFQTTYNAQEAAPAVEEIPLPKHTAPPSLEELVNPADPYQLYSGLKKIGEGYNNFLSSLLIVHSSYFSLISVHLETCGKQWIIKLTKR